MTAATFINTIKMCNTSNSSHIIQRSVKRSLANISQEKVPLYPCPQLCQMLTDCQNSFMVRVSTQQ